MACKSSITAKVGCIDLINLSEMKEGSSLISTCQKSRGECVSGTRKFGIILSCLVLQVSTESKPTKKVKLAKDCNGVAAGQMPQAILRTRSAQPMPVRYLLHTSLHVNGIYAHRVSHVIAGAWHVTWTACTAWDDLKIPPSLYCPIPSCFEAH